MCLNSVGFVASNSHLKNKTHILKFSLCHILMLFFPEYPPLLITVHSKGAYAVLNEFASPESILKVKITKLENILKNGFALAFWQNQKCSIKIFQSTLSVRRATASALSVLSLIIYFNPRSP